MTTLRNKWRLIDVSRKTHDHSRNSQWQDTSVPGNIDGYITEISAEIDGRLTKKLPQELSSTDSRTLGALSKLENFLLNPLVGTLSGTIPGTSQIYDLENREPAGDRSQKDRYPEVKLSACRSNNSNDSDPEKTSHIHKT